jgi:hypothetical protein
MIDTAHLVSFPYILRSSGMDPAVSIKVLGTEKFKHKHDKFYAYCLAVSHKSGKHVNIWRRYSEFDSLRETLESLLKTKSHKTHNADSAGALTQSLLQGI